MIRFHVRDSSSMMSSHTQRAYWALHRVLLRRIGLTALLIGAFATITPPCTRNLSIRG